MRRTRIALLLALLIVVVAAPTASAHGRNHHGSGGWWWWHHTALPGVLPPWLPLHRHTLKDFATNYTVWAFSSADDNPVLEGRCEQSPLDPKVWYLPVSLGGDPIITCDIPKGAFLLLSPGFTECSNVEDPPWYAADVPGLKVCVDATLEDFTYVEVTIDGRTSSHLKRYIVRTRAVSLPPNNLLSSDPALSMSKGYFMLIAPMKRGTHAIRSYDEFSDGTVATVTYEINVH